MAEDLLTRLAAAAAATVLALEPAGHDELLQAVVDAAREIFGAAACSLALVDEAADEIVYRVASGAGAQEVLGMRLPLGRGVAGWVVASGMLIAVDDVAADPRFVRDVAERTGYVPRSILATPLQTDQALLGVLSVLDRELPADVAASQREMVLLGLFATQAAFAIDAARLYGDVSRVVLDALRRAEPGDEVEALLTRAAEASRPGDRLLLDLAALFARTSGLVVTSSLPAWAWQFEPGHLPVVPAMALESPITLDWAFAGASGRGVRVAVVDSGIEAGHPMVGEVAGGVVIEPDGSGFRIMEGPHEDLFGHGTACAGIIRSLAPECELHSVRVLGKRLTGRGTVFAAGLQWAIDAGMDVVNISMSTHRRELVSTFHRIAPRDCRQRQRRPGGAAAPPTVICPLRGGCRPWPRRG